MAQYQPVTGRGQFKARDSGHNATIQRMREQLMPFLNAHKENSRAILQQQQNWLKDKEAAQAMEAENRKMIHGFEDKKIANRISETKSVARQWEQYGEEEARGILRQGDALANFSKTVGEIAQGLSNNIAHRALEFKRANDLATSQENPFEPDNKKTAEIITKGLTDLDNKQNEKYDKNPVATAEHNELNPAAQKRSADWYTNFVTSLRQKNYSIAQAGYSYPELLEDLKLQMLQSGNFPRKDWDEVKLNNLASHLLRDTLGINGNSLPEAIKLSEKIHRYTAEKNSLAGASKAKAINAALTQREIKRAVFMARDDYNILNQVADTLTNSGAPLQGLAGERLTSRSDFVLHVLYTWAESGDWEAVDNYLNGYATQNVKIKTEGKRQITNREWLFGKEGKGNPLALNKLIEARDNAGKFLENAKSIERYNQDQALSDQLITDFLNPDSELNQKIDADELDVKWIQTQYHSTFAAAPQTKNLFANIIYNQTGYTKIGTANQQARWLYENDDLSPSRVMLLASTIKDKNEKAEFNNKWGDIAKIHASGTIKEDNNTIPKQLVASSLKLLNINKDSLDQITEKATIRALNGRHLDVFDEMLAKAGKNDPNLSIQELSKKAWEEVSKEFSLGINDPTSRWHITPAGTRTDGNQLAEGKGIGKAYFTFQFRSIASEPGYKTLPVQLYGVKSNPDAGLLNNISNIESNLATIQYFPISDLRDMYNQVIAGKPIKYTSRFNALYDAIKPTLIAQNPVEYLSKSDVVKLQLQATFNEERYPGLRKELYWENFATKNPHLVDLMDRRQIIGSGIPLVGKEMPETEQKIMNAKTLLDLAKCSAYIGSCRVEGGLQEAQNEAARIRVQNRNLRNEEQLKEAQRIINEATEQKALQVRFRKPNPDDGPAERRGDLIEVTNFDWDAISTSGQHLHDLLEKAGLNYKGFSTNKELDFNAYEGEPLLKGDFFLKSKGD